jgi:EPS-associated MarR family transcriptional regulator
MSEKQVNQEKLDVLRKIKNNPETSQRKLANELGFSLGKLNYLLNAFMEKGLVKIKNFKKNPKKSNYLYILTKRGLTEKTKLTIHFMERKMREYDELKKEITKDKD